MNTPDNADNGIPLSARQYISESRYFASTDLALSDDSMDIIWPVSNASFFPIHQPYNAKTHAGSQRTPRFACLTFSLVGFQNAEQQIFTPNLSYTLKLLRHSKKNFTGGQGKEKA